MTMPRGRAGRQLERAAAVTDATDPGRFAGRRQYRAAVCVKQPTAVCVVRRVGRRALDLKRVQCGR